ncbi:hypothetical protein OROGR_017495 [Orobanche gracilis]
MNLTSADPTAPPPQPPQPPGSSFSCDRHPDEQFTGFCPSCLCERLTTLDSSTANTTSFSRRPSSAAAALKSLFSTTSRANHLPPPPPPPPKPSKPTSFFPELRRSKSFSASKNEALAQSLEPHRKSCDVRAKNTLWSLFSLDDGKPAPASSSSNQKHPINNTRLTESRLASTSVLDEVENEEEFEDPPENLEDIAAASVEDDVDSDEIRPIQDSNLPRLPNAVEMNVNSTEIVEENPARVNNLKLMKDHIDRITQGQEKKSSSGGFWSAASVFSKKWLKWRHKQKIKKHIDGKSLTSLPVEKPISRHYRETQSEIADYGFGRRSCDVDPRFSLDAPRMSFDGPRYSFDEPRASWDGYLVGRNFPRMAPMVSVSEDVPPSVRADMHIPLEAPHVFNQNVNMPGGSVQTRDYYLDSSSRRRKSLDRSNSIRKTAAAVVAEIDELKMAPSNAKVLPTNADYFHGARVSDSYPNFSKEDISETFELAGGFRERIIGNGEKKESKKAKKWSWKIWGFMHRHKHEDDEEKSSRYSSINGVERSSSHSWQESMREGNVDSRGGLNGYMLRSNSTVSVRSANQVGRPYGNARRSNVEMYANSGNRGSDFAFDKNRNLRYSPSNLDNGLLRFYLTPMRNKRRGGTGKIKPTNSNSVARSVMRLY